MRDNLDDVLLLKIYVSPHIELERIRSKIEEKGLPFPTNHSKSPLSTLPKVKAYDNIQ